MKKYLTSALFPIVLIGSAVFFVYWQYNNIKNNTPNVYVTIDSQHGSIGNLVMGSQVAWGKLLTASDIKNVKLIKSQEYIIVTNPIQWLQIIVTDKEQKSIILETLGEKVLSGIGFNYNEPSSLLTVYLYINPEQISEENINKSIASAIWAISVTNEAHPSEQQQKITSYSNYLSRSGNKLVEDIVFNKK